MSRDEVLSAVSMRCSFMSKDDVASRVLRDGGWRRGGRERRGRGAYTALKAL